MVTCSYHTRRARLIFHCVLGDRARGLSFVSAPTEAFQPDDWWQTEDGFLAIVGEYVKLAQVALLHTSLPYWLAAGLAVAICAGWARRRGWPFSRHRARERRAEE